MRSKRPPVLVLAGLGLDYPRQATLEVINELRGCDVVFSNLSGAEATRFLTLFCGDVRTVSYQGERDENRCASKIVSALKPGRRVAFVTRGHPLVSGNLAQTLMRLARRRGASVVSPPAISTIDAILSLSRENFQISSAALQIYDSRLVAEKRAIVQPGMPMILYLGLRRARGMPGKLAGYLNALFGRLSRFYPARHRVFLFGPRYDARVLEPLTLGRLKDRLSGEPPETLSSLILFVPALARKKIETP